MDNMFETGLEKRKATLGAEYVDGVFENADEFSRPFQEAMTAWCLGFGWGDEAIDAKTRSMMNLAMIGALGKMHEWELHLHVVSSVRAISLVCSWRLFGGQPEVASRCQHQWVM